MPEKNIAVPEQFDDIEQQREASRLGLWAFLATEVLFFGGLFMAYAVYRMLYPQGFAIAGQHTNLFYGSINTALLLTSGLTMALGVHAIQQNKTKTLVRYLLLTILLGVGFLVIKGLEYFDDMEKHLVPGVSFALPERPASEMFFYLYWVMTGLHTLHLIVGIGLLAAVAFLASRNHYSDGYYAPVELSGLYWAFVDIVWLYLYPLLYLIHRYQ
jgi:cytochrome c oxidase subunit 3